MDFLDFCDLFDLIFLPLFEEFFQFCGGLLYIAANQFVITEEVRALREYRKKAIQNEPLTIEDEEYILALKRKVKVEQARPGYEYYSPPKYYDADGNLISFEKYVLLKILAWIDQMQGEGVPEQQPAPT